MSAPATEPSLAERARTALAVAKVATLATKPCPARSTTLTVVAVQDRPDGRPLIRLQASSPTAREFAGGRVATLAVPAPAPFWRLELTGPMESLRERRAGEVLFRLSTLSCRLVGATSATIPVNSFFAAWPDPLRAVAPTMIEHLAQAHSHELLACIQAHGYRSAQAVVPRAVDRYGIELSALTAEGVECVRLPFPGGPIDTLQQAPAGLVVPLTCRCPGGHQQGC